MFKVVYEVVIRGLPEEQLCISRVRDSLMSSGSECVGHQLMLLCSSGEVMIKLTPFTDQRMSIQPQMFREITYPQLYVVIEGVKAGDVVRIADLIYKGLRECGIALKLLT